MAGLCEGGNEPPSSLKAITYSQTTKKGYIIDPTIRIETGSSQPEDVNQEKINIHLPTVDYFKVKYQLENIEEEKNELVVSLTEKKLPTEEYTGRNGERDKSSSQKKI
ncbi:hypothetical protein ANN_11412 [Periplaneta americana]|uniref:Uncharacterized protein n=1 Tax=Periplaneta americana TaxID=6978 RepID=A0ABQ8T6C6_PERAM|nr:hypothetical protein ANN_11412 [Periplaneta americana]